tara:strand:- start:1951 stop:2199 length:249 start_codon:yes stop_codon:yes gene_type:complete
MNEIEEKIFKILKVTYGETWEALDEPLVQDKLDKCHELYDSNVILFKKNQSASNYNMLTIAMVSLQYWNQKKIKMFSLVEDF